jgi:hypothetical protein
MAETHVERVHTENVVLDIGGHTGALIIYTDDDRCSEEIELSPKESESSRVHNQVHERRFHGHSVFAAVYPDLKAGDYIIWQNESTPAGEVTIVGGEVATVDWRSAKSK